MVMSMLVLHRLVVAISFFCAFTHVTLASTLVSRQNGIKMMIVGDSITHGTEGDYTWRYRLWQWLRAEGVSVDFVGPWSGTYGPIEPKPPQPPLLQGESEPPSVDLVDGGYAKDIDSDFDKRHFAHSGRQVNQVKDRIGFMIVQYSPDYALIELGFNDLGWFVSGAERLLQNMKILVQNARAAKSDIKLAIANVPYRTRIGGRQDLIDKTDEYNSLLAAALPQWSTEESPIELVRFRENYRCEVDDCPAAWDGLHPNQLGEYTIAQAFSRALHSRFGIATKALDVPANLPARPCPPPSNIKATPAPYGIKVTWDKVYGAHGYRVRSRRSTTGEWTDTPYMLSTHRFDTVWVLDGETWDYAVRTDCGDAQKSTWTSGASAVANPSVPPAPRNVVINPSLDGFSARWDPPAGSWDVDFYEVITYDQDQECDILISRGIKGTSITVGGLRQGHSYVVAIGTWSKDGPGFPTIAFSPIPGLGKPSAPRDVTIGTRDATTIKLTFVGDDASANYRVWSRNINNESDYLKADDYTSDLPCYGVAYLFPGVWNFEFCVTALNGNLESAKSECLIPSRDATPSLPECPTRQIADCGWGRPGNGGDGTDQPGGPGGGGGDGGGGDDGSGDVYIDPSIWKDSNPEVSCEPPCLFVLPPKVLPSSTVISLPPYTTKLEVVWTVGGKMTRTIQTTTISLPPVTTRTISFWHQTFPTGSTFTFSPVPQIFPPPIIVTNDRNPESSPGVTHSPVTRTITPSPYPTDSEDDDGDDDHYGGPFPPITVKDGPPSPICSSGCGSPCQGGSCTPGRPCVPLITCPRGDDWQDPSDPDKTNGGGDEDEDDDDDDDDDDDEDQTCSFPPLQGNPPPTRPPRNDETPEILDGPYPGPYDDDDDDDGGGGGGDDPEPNQRLWVFYMSFLSEAGEWKEWWFKHRLLDGSDWSVCSVEPDVVCSTSGCLDAPDGELSKPPWPDGEWTMSRGRAKGCVYRGDGKSAGSLSCTGRDTIVCKGAAVVHPEVAECPPLVWRADFYAAVICDYA